MVKKLQYSGLFNLRKDFQHRQKVKVCLFICINEINELWLLNDFFLKNCGFRIVLKILKLLSAIFCQIFIFSPNDSPSKTMKGSFFSQDIQIFVIFPDVLNWLP